MLPYHQVQILPSKTYSLSAILQQKQTMCSLVLNGDQDSCSIHCHWHFKFILVSLEDLQALRAAAGYLIAILTGLDFSHLPLGNQKEHCFT